MAQMVGKVNMVDAEYMKQIEGAHRDLHNLLSNNMQLAPVVLRMAFHDAATYDAKKKVGGPNGSIRNELNNPPNNGIKIAVDFCEQVKVNHPKVTYADLYQLAGIVAVEVTGGPKIHFVPGRSDAIQQQDKGSLPNPNGGNQHLRDIFHRMGFSDKEIVVLSGAHTLGRAHKNASGFDGPFTRQPLKFDNSYFVELMKGDTPGLVKFPTDKALLQDPVFRPYVQLYAKDEKVFFKDYAKAHKKLSELGFHPNAHQHPQDRHHPIQQPHPHPHHRSHSHSHPQPHPQHHHNACPPQHSHPHPQQQQHPHPACCGHA